RVVDEYWMEHIDAMDDLKQGIRLQAYGQEDPVKAFKREGANMFDEMNMAIQHEAVRRIYVARVQTNKVERKAVAKVTGESAGGEAKEKPRRAPIRKAKKIGPNDPCPCGSGKKYKKCCGRDRGME
ncbi:MAG: SEC-C metal-binding domain-containing protein, partial [Candidatus Onthomonas sp.]|nr:SEC-C metal-binding domain-containing protein [Candidatus Onthomonas sp.]